jgi:transcriptional regulator with XRE-family HTH domain
VVVRGGDYEQQKEERMFGGYVKEVRLNRRLSLREFCRQLGEDASNWSKVEREIMAPPQDRLKLERIADILGIEKGGERNRIFDMASVDAGNIPEYVMDDKEVLKALPVFFRTVGSVKPTAEELAQLIENIKKGA